MPGMPRKKEARPVGMFEEFVGGNGLTRQETVFVFAYIREGNARKAAAEAGYDLEADPMLLKSLGQRGPIRAAVQAEQKRLAARLAVNAEWVTEELAKIARSNIAHLTRQTTDGAERVVDFTHATYDDLAAVSELHVDTYLEGRGDDARSVRSMKVKFHSKIEALKTLNSNLGLSKQAPEDHGVTVTGGLPDEDV